ncbi:MAG: prolipoprotein diacylglyceryl transferase [Verrucomicrobia bacterium]|nr:prolipoprotein diacylglyceryl transferase [Verrucomicrobiota bacterium]
MSTYGFFAAAGAVTAIAWLRRHHRAMGLTENEFWAALWLIVAGAVVGAKALFIALGWHHYASGELRFWADFGTGFVFFGGLLGAALAGGMFAWRRRLSFWRGADYFGVALPLGHAMGRVGCYSQGCCAGRASHPVQLYESVGLLVIAFIAHRVLRSVNAGKFSRGAAFCAYGFFYGALRLALDPLRADGRPERWLGLSPQQGIAIALMLAASAGVWWLGRDRPTTAARVTVASTHSAPSRSP